MPQQSGISFSEHQNSSKVFLTNIMLLHCHQMRNTHNDSIIQAAIYFRNSLYTLSGVTVKNTDGYGLYAEYCVEHIIFNCTFTSNKGNVRLVLLRRPGIVSIHNTKIHEGKGIRMEVNVFAGWYNLSIINCDF